MVKQIIRVLFNLKTMFILMHLNYTKTCINLNLTQNYLRLRNPYQAQWMNKKNKFLVRDI